MISEAGFENMETYILRKDNIVVRYIAKQLILDLCEAADRNWGERVVIRWWEQAGIYLAWARETVEAAAEMDKDGMEE